MMCHAGFGGVDTATGEYTCFLETFGGGLRRTRRAATGPTPSRRTARTRRTRRSRRPSAGTRCTSTGSRSSRTPDGPGRFRGGLGLRKDYRFDRPLTFTVLADRTKAGPVGRPRRRGRRAGPLRPRPRRRRAGAQSEEHDRPARRRRRQLPDLRRRRLRAAATEREPARCCATCSRGRSAASARATCTGSRSTTRGGWTMRRRLRCGRKAFGLRDRFLSRRPRPVGSALDRLGRLHGVETVRTACSDGMWTNRHTFETKDT